MLARTTARPSARTARAVIAASAALGLTVVAGCGGGAKHTGATGGTAAATSTAPTTPAQSSGTSPSPSAGSSTPATPPPAPASVHANELGLVPVLMYHQIKAHPTSDYDRRPKDFQADLQTLYAEGYVPVTAADFVAGRIDIPAGKHPVVLTFDDATESQFVLGSDGNPKPGTAVAMIEDFAKAHPGFPAHATFYVNHTPFGTKAGEGALPWLVAHGFEVGDHTVNHLALRTLSGAKVQQEIADNLAMIQHAVPGIHVTTMALPFGVSPVDKALAHHGAADGVSYDFKAVFLVGANPARSPFNVRFEPFAVPRIRAENVADARASDRPYISGYYLPWLQQHRDELYTSDGDPAHVSFPKSWADRLNPAYKSEAQAY